MTESYFITSRHFTCWIFSTQLCNVQTIPAPCLTWSDVGPTGPDSSTACPLASGVTSARPCPRTSALPATAAQPPAPATSESRSVRVSLFVTRWTVAYLAPLSMGFSRQEYWRGSLFPCPGDLPNPGIESQSPALQTDSLYSEQPGKLPDLKSKAKRVVQWGPESRSSGHLLVSLRESQISRLFFTNKLSSPKKQGELTRASMWKYK